MEYFTGGEQVDYDASVLRRAKNGDDKAFDRLVEPHVPRCYRVAWMITRNPDDASDALQEALYRVYRSLRNFTTGRPFYPWFAKIVVNEALKMGKRASRQSAFLPLTAVEYRETPEGTVLAREEQERLWQAIRALPPNQRTAIVLRYYGEMSEQEMAEALKVSPGTVKSRLHRARAALEQEFGSDQPSQAAAKVLRLNPNLQGGANNE